MNTALRAGLKRQLEHEQTYTRSWWRETPWPEIERYAKACMSAEEFGVWLKRPDVVERAAQQP